MLNAVAGLKDVGLLGVPGYNKAQIDQWIDFAALEIDINARAWVLPHLGLGFFNEEVIILTSI